MILRCICKHEYQDKRYGPQMRVFNPTTKGEGKKKGWRCTVCGAPMQTGSDEKDTNEKESKKDKTKKT